MILLNEYEGCFSIQFFWHFLSIPVNATQACFFVISKPKLVTADFMGLWSQPVLQKNKEKSPNLQRPTQNPRNLIYKTTFTSTHPSIN
jgi:hypothetical protein